MPYKQIKKAIDELNVELKKTPKETGALEEILEKARDGIEGATPDAVQQLIDTLQHESDDFEAEHPRVVALINRLMNTLSGMGI